MVNIMLISKFNTIVPDTYLIDHLKQGWDLTAVTCPRVSAWTVYGNSENYRSACQFGCVVHYL